MITVSIFLIITSYNEFIYEKLFIMTKESEEIEEKILKRLEYNNSIKKFSSFENLRKKIFGESSIIENHVYSALKESDKLIYYSINSQQTIKKLFGDVETGRNLDTIFHYFTSKDPGSFSMAKEALRYYANNVEIKKENIQKLSKNDKKIHKIAQNKLNRALMLAAKSGDLDLFKIILNRGGNIVEDKKLFVDEEGKNILHYACMSNNAELAKLCADKIQSEYINEYVKNKQINPFEIGNNSLVNKVYPKDLISNEMAEKLDNVYGLDSNHKGSFCSVYGYNSNHLRITSQGISYLADLYSNQDKTMENRSLGSQMCEAARFITWKESLKKSILNSNLVAVTKIGMAGILCASIIGIKNKIQRNILDKKSRYSNKVDFQLNKNEQENKAQQQDYNYDDKTNKSLIKALQYRDIDNVKKITEKKSFSHTDNKVMRLVFNVASFGDDNKKITIFENLAQKSSTKNMEKIINHLASRGPDNFEVAKKVLNKLVDSFSQNSAQTHIEDVIRLKKCAFMAAEYGDIKLLNKAIDSLKSKGISNLLEISDENKSNLMHYACKGNNAEMIRYLEPKLSKEFNLMDESAKKHQFLWHKTVANNIFELPNNQLEKPKHFLKQDTSVSLDLMYANSLSYNKDNIGFSAYTNNYIRKKINETTKNYINLALGSSLQFLTGVLVIESLPATANFFKNIAHNLVPGSGAIANEIRDWVVAPIEAATVIENSLLTEQYTIHKVQNFFKNVKYHNYFTKKNYDTLISAFNEDLSVKTNKIFKLFISQLEKDKKTIKRSKNEFNDIINSLKKSLKKSQLIDKSMKEIANNIINNTIGTLDANRDNARKLITDIYKFAELKPDIDYRQERELLNSKAAIFFRNSENILNYHKKAAKKILEKKAKEFTIDLEISYSKTKELIELELKESKINNKTVSRIKDILNENNLSSMPNKDAQESLILGVSNKDILNKIKYCKQILEIKNALKNNIIKPHGVNLEIKALKEVKLPPTVTEKYVMNELNSVLYNITKKPNFIEKLISKKDKHILKSLDKLQLNIEGKIKNIQNKKFKSATEDLIKHIKDIKNSANKKEELYKFMNPILKSYKEKHNKKNQKQLKDTKKIEDIVQDYIPENYQEKVNKSRGSRSIHYR